MASAPEEAVPVVETLRATVTRVIDGDTVYVRMEGGTEEKIRFIGVDTPESTTQIDVYGKEASAYTDRQLSGATVFLETDVELRDRYGRLLAYVWLAPPDAVSDSEIREHMFNARLALDGYAQQMTIQPNSKYATYFAAYVAEARNADKGLWNPNLAQTAAEPVSVPAPSSATASYVGNRNSHKFHSSTCRYVAQMNPANKVPFNSRSRAIAAGYVPCKVCEP